MGLEGFDGVAQDVGGRSATSSRKAGAVMTSMGKASRDRDRPRRRCLRGVGAPPPGSLRRERAGPCRCRGTGKWRRQGVPEATLTAMSRARKLLQHLGSPPRMPTACSAQRSSMSHWVCGPVQRRVRRRVGREGGSWLSGSGSGRFGIQSEDLEEEFFVDVLALLAGGGQQEFVGHVHEQAQVAGGVFAEGLDQGVGHELGVAGGLEQRCPRHSRSSLGGRGSRRRRLRMRLAMGKQIAALQALGEAVVAGEDDGEDGAGVEFGAGQQAQFAEDRGVHLLGFVDEQDRAVERALDVSEPLLAQGLGAVPAVVGREGHAEEIAEFAVEVGHLGLGPAQHPHAQIAHWRQALGEDAQGGALAACPGRR